MEQSDIPRMQLLQSEESAADVDVQSIHVTEIVVDQDAKAAATVTTEDGQDLSNECQLQLECSLPANNTDSNVESKSEDHTDASDSDALADKVHSDTNDRSKYDAIKPETKTCVLNDDTVDICEHIKDELNESSNYELQSLSNKEDQSLNVITESNIVEEKKDAMHTVNSDAHVVDDDADQSDAVDKQQCSVSDKAVSENSEVQVCETHESAEKAIKEMHDNDSNQNSSIVTNAELTKLVNDDETEVVVVLEEAVTDATADNFIISVKGEKGADKGYSQETVMSALQGEKKAAEPGHEINEFANLIHYSQEGDGTIIEVIATEIVQSPEQRRDSGDCAESNKCDTETTKKLTDGEGHQVAQADESIKERDSSKGVVNSVIKEEEEDVAEMASAIIIDEKIIITENVSPEAADAPTVETNAHEQTGEAKESQAEEAKEADPPTSVDSTKKRSVIQDIFDDWGVENTDEDAQSTSREHDSVEIELKSLLDESTNSKSDRPSVANKPHVAVGETSPRVNKEHAADDARDVANATEKSSTKKQTGQTEQQKKSKDDDTTVSRDASSEDGNEDPAVGKSSRSLNATSTAKNRSRHLTSQIASPAEVTEVLKERLREKQKVVVDAPRAPDIFFVKKLTQRLSSKLAGNPVPSPANPTPPSLPPQQSTPSSLPSPSAPAPPTAAENCDKNATTGGDTEASSKDGSADNKELLAILEGDVDPDWSILKPPTLTEESKAPPSNVEHLDHSGDPPKLDPLVEREMALKQLLELPVTSSKKSGAARKKKTFKPAPGKAAKEQQAAKDPGGRGSPLDAQAQKKIISIDLANENARTAQAEHTEIDLVSPPREQNPDGPKDHDSEATQATRAEESRSGRKRKLTEKAREHEQLNTIKRQKVYKGKVSVNKRQVQEANVADDDPPTESPAVEVNDASTTKMDVPKIDDVAMKEATDGKQFDDKIEPSLSKPENSPLKRPKQSLAKKGSQPITKRKVVVKKLLRQKMSPAKKPPVKLKAKLSASPPPPPPKKSPSPKVIPKSQKRASEGATADAAKPKKKNINEIDRLLQDEGVVNLLYDVEQPDKKKRLVPITKSRAKVMDLQKVQRELKIRKKLVRNAVLRLRTSSGSVTKVSPRSKRTAHPSDVATDGKKTAEQSASPRIPNATSSPTEFILPAKIRNAADASIIVRRHSSSSFSSASGSPRVSVDTPDKPVAELAKLDDGTVHSLRSAKRRHSQDDKIVNVKKTKKKTTEKPDADAATAAATGGGTGTAALGTGAISVTTTAATTTNATANNADEKTVAAAVRPSKKSEMKKVDKAGAKQQQEQHIPPLENSVTSSKVTTRSNGAATGKVTAKSKRAVKSKVSFVRPSEAESPEDSSKEEAELTACLAEAATALSVVNAGRTGNNANTRKSKGKGKVRTSTELSLRTILILGMIVELIAISWYNAIHILSTVKYSSKYKYRENVGIR